MHLRVRLITARNLVLATCGDRASLEASMDPRHQRRPFLNRRRPRNIASRSTNRNDVWSVTAFRDNPVNPFRMMNMLTEQAYRSLRDCQCISRINPKLREGGSVSLFARIENIELRG